MKCGYSVTFEFETQQPITIKGEATGTTVRTIAARAIDDALEQSEKKMIWSSIVILIMRNPTELEKPKEEE
jgi:hypothetical protein